MPPSRRTASARRSSSRLLACAHLPVKLPKAGSPPTVRDILIAADDRALYVSYRAALSGFDFDFLLADRSRAMTMREWERAGIQRPGGKAFPRPGDKAYLLVPAGAQNFKVTYPEDFAMAEAVLRGRVR